MLEGLSRKLASVRQLVARNRLTQPGRYMGFPFLIVEPSGLPRTNLAIKMQSDLRKLAITSNREVHLYGDLEVVAMIDTAPRPPPAPREQGFTGFQRL